MQMRDVFHQHFSSLGMPMSTPPIFSVLLCSAIVALTLVLVQGTELFPKNCTEMYVSKQTKISKTDKLEAMYTSCGFWGVSRCKKYRKKVVTRIEYIITYKERKVCCNGSIPVNETTCTTECPEGQYGNDCSLNCSCPSIGKWSSRCDKMSGNCSCENGYQGSSCDEVCPSGLFGENCAEKCPCHGDSTCYHIDGSCNCTVPGWTGQYCQNRCTNLTFGYNCEEECNCTANETCDPVNGMCMCKPGLTGEGCKTECTNFTYGPDCRDVCDCDRNHSTRCDPATGDCICLPGWEGQTCAEVCSLFRYGEECSKNCTCGSTNFCHHIDGRCFSDLCYGPNTLNCGHQDDVDFCKHLENGYALNVSSFEISEPIQHKLKDICSTLEYPKTKMICLAENPCDCSFGSEGTFCSKALVNPDQIASGITATDVALIAISLTFVLLLMVATVGGFLFRNLLKEKARRKAISNRTHALADFNTGDGIIPAINQASLSGHHKYDMFEEQPNEDDYDKLSRSGNHKMKQVRTTNANENMYSHIDSAHYQTDGTYSHVSNKPDQTDDTYSRIKTGGTNADTAYDYMKRESYMDTLHDNPYSLAVIEKSDSPYTNCSNVAKDKKEHYNATNAEESIYNNTI